MKVIVASSERNKVEQKVLIYTLLAAGHEEDDIYIMDGTSGNILDCFQNEVLLSMGKTDLGKSTSFTLARLYAPLYLKSNQFVILDSDIIVFSHLSGIFSGENKSGIYVRKAYAPQEWATSVLGWNMSLDSEFDYDRYESIINDENLDWRDKIYLKPDFLRKAGLNVIPISKHWNSFDSISPDTYVLHFTNLATQPWKVGNHPLESLWFSLAKEAYQKNILTDDDIEAQMKFSDIIVSGAPILRPDFEKVLHGEPVAPNLIQRSSNNFRLFYKNLKFHSPLKFIYSEFF